MRQLEERRGKDHKKGVLIMVDMYMHTIYSDGDKTVEQVLKLCKIKVFAHSNYDKIVDF